MKKITVCPGSIILLRLVLTAFIIMSMGSSVYGSDYPDKPISLVIGSSPGGGFDMQGRLFAKYWPPFLPGKAKMIVSNIDGGGGLESANQVWSSPPDGYKIVQLKLGAYILNEILYPQQVKFKMDLWQYIGTYTYTINAMFTRPAIWEKIKTFHDLAILAKEKPLVFGTGGVGSATHNFLQIVAEATGIPMRFVHYEGGAGARLAVIRGDIDFAIAPPSQLMNQDPKDIRTLFIINDQERRYTYAPHALDFGVPKDAYQKMVKNPILMGWRCWAVPPKTPANVVKILRDSYWKVVESKELNQDFKKVNDFLQPRKDEEFAKELPIMISDIKKTAILYK